MLVRITNYEQIDSVNRALKSLGLWTSLLRDEASNSTALMIRPHSASVDPQLIKDIPGVIELLATPSAHPLVDRAADTLTLIGHEELKKPYLMAGPCSVESPESIDACARHVRAIGGQFLRGGAFKPRTSPYEFCGEGRQALGWLRTAADAHGLKVVTEVLSEVDVAAVAEVADLIQIGARNMQNFALLRAVGETKCPVLLKRSRSASIDEWLLAGEHVYNAGSEQVIFCERGIQNFDHHTRNMLDLSAVAVLRHQYRLPVIVDPSHAAGRRDLITPLALGALAVGAVGVMVEINDQAAEAKSDGPQALNFGETHALAVALKNSRP